MRRLNALVPLLLLSAGLASCGRATPLCDYANGLVKTAQLSQAADAYATAERAKEGDCASDGLKHVGELRAEAGTYDARGRAAQRAGELPAATASFRAALAIDHGDTEATAALQSLTRSTVTPAPAPSIVPVLVKGPPGRDAGRGLAWLALALVLIVTVVTIGLALWIRANRLALDRVAAAIDESQARDAQLRADVLRLIESGRAEADEVDEWFGPKGDR